MRARLPGVPEAIAQRVCDAVARLRERGALQAARRGGDDHVGARAAGARRPTSRSTSTLGVALKVREDIERVRERECSGCLSAGAAVRTACSRLAAQMRARRRRTSASASCSPRTARSPRSTPRRASEAFYALRAALCSSHADLGGVRRGVRARLRRAGRGSATTRSSSSAQIERAALPRLGIPAEADEADGRRSTPVPAAWSEEELLREQGLRATTPTPSARSPGGCWRGSRGAAPQRVSRRTRADAAAPRGPRPARARSALSLRHGGELVERRYRAPGAAAAPARARLRRFRLDGALRADAAAVPAGLRGGARRASRRSCSARG